jgi:hypothetical protein
MSGGDARPASSRTSVHRANASPRASAQVPYRSVTVPTAGQAVFCQADECEAAAAAPWMRDQSQEDGRVPQRSCQARVASRAREASPARQADATAALAARPGSRFMPLGEVLAARHVLGADRGVEEIVLDLTTGMGRKWT